MTDTELIQAVKNGNDKAFKELVLRYESRIASTVIGMLGNCPEAEDAGQETFIRFYRALPNFRGESSVITYMTRIAINLSLNELKRRKRRAILFKNKSEEYLANVADDNTNYNTDEQEIIYKGLKKLEPKFRSVIVLRLIEGYSTKETAEILSLPIGTVLSRLARAQEKLKTILSPYLEIKNEQKNKTAALSII